MFFQIKVKIRAGARN